MANTTNGIYYPDNYNDVADVPNDMKKLSESVDIAIENIKTEETKQYNKIIELQNKNTELEQQVVELSEENTTLKNQIPTGEASGNPIHISDSSDMECEIAVIGNAEQNGEPTPENPVEIVTVGQEINYVSNAPSAWEQGTISGTDGSTTDSTTRIRTKGFVDIRNSAKITCNLDNTSYKVLNIHFYNENYGYLRNSSILYNISNFNKATVSVPTNVKYIKVVICKNNNATIVNTDTSAFTIKIEKGSIAIPCGQNGIGIVIENGNDTTQSQSKLLPIQKEMLKIGDVEDTFIKRGDKWYEAHYHPKIVLNGTENGWFYNSTQKGFSITGLATPETEFAYSTHFKCSNSYSTWAGLYKFGFNTAGTLWLQTGDLFTSVAEWTSWLANNNVEIIYTTLTPELIPCTPEQEEILNSFHTYKNVTNITASGIANLKVNYKKDQDTINKNNEARISALEAAIVS